MGLLFGVLGEEKETLAGLACPGSCGVCDFCLVTTEVRSELVVGDGLLAEPEVLLGELQAPVLLLVLTRGVMHFPLLT